MLNCSASIRTADPAPAISPATRYWRHVGPRSTRTSKTPSTSNSDRASEYGARVSTPKGRLRPKAKVSPVAQPAAGGDAVGEASEHEQRGTADERWHLQQEHRAAEPRAGSEDVAEAVEPLREQHLPALRQRVALGVHPQAGHPTEHVGHALEGQVPVLGQLEAHQAVEARIS